MKKQKFRTILRFIGLTNDITAIPRLIWIGGGAVIVALGHVFEAIRNLSLGYQILFAFGVLLLWLAGILFVAGWFRGRKQPLPTGMSNEVVPQDQQCADWMTTELLRERKITRNFFQVRQDWFGLYLDSVSGPYLLFRFAVRTSTIHTFEFIPEKTSGHIKYMKQDLARVPEVEDQSHDILTRETQNMLAVKQFLEPVTESHIRKLHGNQEVPEASFEFGELNIYMKAIQPDGSIDKELWKLPLPGVWKVRIADEDIRS